MTFSTRRRTLVLVGLLLANFFSAASAAEPTASIVESHEIWDSRDTVKSTDVARYRDQWICVMQTDAGLRMIGSNDGKTWRQLSTVTSSDKKRPLFDPRLTVTTDGRLMLSAVAPAIQIGGYSKSWFSYDAVKWKGPEPSAEDHYLVSSVFWHVGVAYNFQRGSICGNATTIRIDASDDHGQSFRERFEETFDSFWPGRGALVFSQDYGFCVMQLTGKKPHGALGVSKAPFTYWKWKQLPWSLKHPNAIRAKSGMMLVVAGLSDDAGKLQTTLCKLDPETPQLVPMGKIPTSQSCLVGLANHEDQVFLSYHTRTDDGSTVHFARVSIEKR